MCNVTLRRSTWLHPRTGAGGGNDGERLTSKILRPVTVSEKQDQHH